MILNALFKLNSYKTCKDHKYSESFHKATLTRKRTFLTVKKGKKKSRSLEFVNNQQKNCLGKKEFSGVKNLCPIFMSTLRAPQGLHMSVSNSTQLSRAEAGGYLTAVLSACQVLQIAFMNWRGRPTK